MNLVDRHTLDKLLALKLAVMVSDLVGKVDLIKMLNYRITKKQISGTLYETHV